MTIKKWAIYFLQILAIIIVAWLCHKVISGSTFPSYFEEITNKPFEDFSNLFLRVFIAVLGVYYFFLLNIIARFKNLLANIIQIVFCIIGIIVSIESLSFIWDTRSEIRNAFNTIPFPTEPDVVSRNIKISVLNSNENMFYAFLGIVIIALLTATINLSKKS
jgi:hypothetical protein